MPLEPHRILDLRVVHPASKELGQLLSAAGVGPCLRQSRADLASPIATRGQHEMKLHGSDQRFDAAAIKREFPSLADPHLHYLDNAATAQMPEVVLGSLRRFELEARANVHEGMVPIAAAVGLGAALDFMQAVDWQAVQDHELGLTRRLLDGLAAINGVRVLGPLDTRDRSCVVSFTVKGFSPEEVCRHLDSHGVALRGGYHCAQPLFRAFGIDGAARASLAPYSLDGDVDALLAGLEDLIR